MDRLEGLLLIALAAHYATYVVTESALFAGVRSYFAKQLPLLGQLAGCYNCMAFWSAGLMWLLWQFYYSAFFVVVCAAATIVQFVMQWRWRSEP